MSATNPTGDFPLESADINAEFHKAYCGNVLKQSDSMPLEMCERIFTILKQNQEAELFGQSQTGRMETELYDLVLKRLTDAARKSIFKDALEAKKNLQPGFFYHIVVNAKEMKLTADDILSIYEFGVANDIIVDQLGFAVFLKFVNYVPPIVSSVSGKLSSNVAKNA